MIAVIDSVGPIGNSHSSGMLQSVFTPLQST